MWGQDLAIVLSQCRSALSRADDGRDAKPQAHKLLAFGERIKTALRDVWKEAPTDVFDNA